MIQYYKNIPVRYKLLTSFGLIIAINALFGMFSIRIMRQLGELVNVTYDKALMSGTFAQAAKFNFAVYDAQTRASLASKNETAFSSSKSKSKKAFETLEEDLQVVTERALGAKSGEIIKELTPSLLQLNQIQQELLTKKNNSIKAANWSQENKLINAWDTAINKSNLYRKLTALYDDAAELGYKFRLESEEKNRLIIYQALIILGFCIFISLLLSFIVAYFLILPIFRLIRVCNDVSNGNYTIRAKVEANDEIGKLATSFNNMLSTIQEKDENIAALLASLPFGLFYIDKTGTISRERSPATDKIFEHFPSYIKLHDFFQAYNLNDRTIDDILKTAFDKILPFKSAVFLFPDVVNIKTENDTRIIQLSYKPHLGHKKKLERIIVIAEDVTAKNKAISESRYQAERVDRISKIAADMPGYQDFLKATRRLLDSIQSSIHQVNHKEDYTRDLHSLKGLLSVYAYSTCATAVHDIESLLSNPHEISENDLTQKIIDVKNLFELQTKDITHVLMIDSDQSLSFFDPAKVKILEKVITQEGSTKLIDTFKDLSRVPIKKAFARYLAHVQDFANKAQDKKIVLSFAHSDEISFSEAKSLDMAMIHLINNSIDHGIESTEQRLQKGKSPEGQITISFHRHPQNLLELKISDDGQGIDLDRLVNKAIENKLLSPEESKALTEDKKIELIFAKGLSTKEDISTTSGRGIGMDAVKDYIESLAGKIAIQTKPNVGSSFVITIPANSETT